MTQTWITWYGLQLSLSEVSHQHLSNILWYYEIVMDTFPPLEAKIELNARFGDIRLPYRPMSSFIQEIDYLFHHGYITNKISSDVVVAGRWVGRLEYS